MEYIKLFSGNENQSYEKYRKLINEMTDLAKVIYNKDLLPYKDNIKLLFNQYLTDVGCIYFECSNSHINYIDKVVYICKQLGDIKLNEKIVKYIDRGYRGEDLLKFIITLYLPHLISNDLKTYLDNCYSYFVHNKCYYIYGEIDVGNSELNDIYTVLRDYMFQDFTFLNLRCYDKILTIILAYLHLNNKYSHDTFVDYIKNIRYFNEKLNMNDIYNIGIQFDSDNCKYIFDNFESIFEYGKKAIR